MELTTKTIENLRIEHITKRFPGVLACDDISLEIGKGEILALVGENGAGKTTLMNILMGLYYPDAGTIFINNEPVHFRSPNDAFSYGIGMVHQQYMLVPNMSVLENIALGYKQAWNPVHLNLKMVRKRIEEVAKHYGLVVDPDAFNLAIICWRAAESRTGQNSCLGAKFLILDEPTSALTPQETDELIILLRKMSTELSIIFISHKLQEVKDLSSKVAILRHGKIVFQGNTIDHSSSDIAALMTGHEVNLPQNDAPACTLGL